MDAAKGLECRLTELEDLFELDKLREKINSQEGTTGISSDTKLSTVIAFSSLCLTAIDPSTNAVVGAMALAPSQLVNHVLPSSEADSELHRWICELASSSAAESPAGLTIPFFVLDPDHEEAALLTILRYAFSTSPSLRSLLLISKETLPLSQPFLLSYFTDTGSRGPGGEVAYSSARESICPAITVRPAVVEDTDDLVPLVEGSADRFGSLAKVPCSHGEASALADFLVSKDASATVLVVEDSTFNIHGLLAVNSAVDAAVLLQHFDLAAYDGLLPTSEYAELVSEAESMILAQQRAAAETKAAEIMELTIAKQKEEDENAEAAKAADALCSSRAPSQTLGEDTAVAAAGEGSEGAAGAEIAPPSLLTGAGIDDGDATDNVDALGSSAAAAAAALEDCDATAAPSFEPEPYSAADIQFQIANIVQERPPTQTTCMALMMLCMDRSWEGRSADAIVTAFRNFPTCHWLLATLPCDEQPPDALAHFDCIAPLPWSPFPHKLFLLHRKALARINVFKACELDRPGIEDLVEGMSDAEAKLAAFDTSCASNLCAVARLGGLVVGTVALADSHSLPTVSSQYTLSAALDAAKYPASSYASLSLCAINPIFAALSRDILSASSAILRRPVILASPSEASAASGSGAAGGMFQHLPPAPGAAPPPLLVLAPPLTFHRKLALDVRVVVVGASETALSALRSIVLRRDTALPRVTLLAPLGAAAAPALLDPQLAAVMHDARVTVLDASMAALDRHAHEVQLDDGSTLVYDVLVLAPGLHNATLSAVKDGGVGGVCSAGELSRHLTAADAAELSGVIVYGDTLDAVTAMGTLSAQGVTLSETALHIAPPGPSGPGLDILLEIAEECEIPIERAQTATLTRLEAITEQHTFHCFFDAEEHPEGLQVQADLLVAAETPDVSPTIFNALCAAGLVYDGRLVVDVSMRCAGDDRILAGGPLVKLSRAAGGQRLEDFASVEIAAALADRLLLTCADVLGIPPPTSAASAAATVASGDPPSLGSTTARMALLPDGLRFVYAAAASVPSRPALDLRQRDDDPRKEPAFVKPPRGFMVTSHSAEGLCKLAVDAHGMIVRSAFLGKNKDVSEDMLTSLMNVPAVLLHADLEQAVAKKEIPCLVQLLLSPWLSNALSPGFRSLLDTLVLSVSETMRVHGDDTGHKKETKLALLDCQDGLTKWVADTSAAQVQVVDVSS